MGCDLPPNTSSPLASLKVEASVETKRRGLEDVAPPSVRKDPDSLRSRLGEPSWLVDVESLASSVRSSLASSLIIPRTRRTMFPTTISLGCASTSLWPTSCIRSRRFPISVHLNFATTRSKRWAVAIAHGREFRICLRLRSLPSVSHWERGNLWLHRRNQVLNR